MGAGDSGCKRERGEGPRGWPFTSKHPSERLERPWQQRIAEDEKELTGPDAFVYEWVDGVQHPREDAGGRVARVGKAMIPSPASAIARTSTSF